MMLTRGQAPENDMRRNKLKQLGTAGFCFFLVKGLAWLVVPVLLAQGCLG